jgi:hypothetical protein
MTAFQYLRQILKCVNQTSERTAKASAYQKSVADLKKAYEASPEFRRTQFIKSALAMALAKQSNQEQGHSDRGTAIEVIRRS